MSNPVRFASAVSAIAVASMIAGCAAPQVKTGFGGKTGDNIGLATRAVVALNSKDVPSAIDFAERAVQKTPDDAGFRAILGNAYFAAGRFASAEAAYKDSLSLYSNQPQVILKLALVETALDKKDEAVAFLQAGREVLDASNYGLALALAGRPGAAIPVLEAAARQPGADATIRQNLALAHALAGDWTEARTIAAQDVPGNQLDARIQQWMQLAAPKKASDQVAALVGVTPAAVDHGQPVRLALRKSDTLLASAAPATSPAAAPVVHPAAHSPRLSRPALVAAAPEAEARAPITPAASAPAVLAAAAPVPTVAPAAPAPKLLDKPLVAEAAIPTPVAMISAAAHEVSTAAASEVKSLVAAVMPKKAVHIVHHSNPTRVASRRPVGPGDSVMQIGSYRSPEQVTAGWNRLTQRFPALRGYLPLRARFDSANGIYWRLSIQGFANQREAMARCEQLRNNGGKCFVRGFAGDSPVEIASR
jgi:Flp pilus assembly protein TadD